MAKETREEAIERGLRIASEKGITDTIVDEKHLKEAIGIGYDLLHPTVVAYRQQW